MRALIISKSGRDIMTIMNFLVKIGYDPSNIVTIMNTRQSIKYWWSWLVDDVSSFVYLDPNINDLSFSDEPFTPSQLRELIYSSPLCNITMLIASVEPFEMYKIYEPYKAQKTSLIYSRCVAQIYIISGKTDIAYRLSSLYGAYYVDLSVMFGYNMTTGSDNIENDRFILL